MSIRDVILAAILLSSTCVASAKADVPNVATDIAPVHSLVAQVMEGLGAPGQVVRPGASPHGYAMRPSEARILQEADVVFWIGPQLTPWLGGAIANLAPQAPVTALLDARGTTLLEFRTGVQFAADDHEHEHESGRGDQESAQYDPHAWLDPQNASVWLGVIADELGRIDPENAETYAANAKASQLRIAAAEAEIGEILAPAKALQFVVFHDAYHYFESRFGLSAAAAIAAGDASDPGPARIEEVRQTMHDLNVACVFSEPEFNPAFVATVIEGTSAKAGLIDPLGAGIEAGPGFYSALLRSVADELVKCVD
ncbi:zinc ABC transporter substrate-binding protein [Roseovarius sp. Pro17]|uniref:zinc ABC transporter substrate-binding protein n=1 Tax=Roseovarius sp. Pro17 TaxID=3108175 RepID=UPI002D76E07F|nr:zinc ABC transporter substrate-binding protein [Roseovarius sp. Pro17]